MAAVDLDRISAITGYVFKFRDLAASSPNLPVVIVALGEANHANQSTLDLEGWRATNLKSVGDRYGYGSPIYAMARILLPVIGGIPLMIHPQTEAVSATSKKYTITPVGTATANATHTVVISGRRGVDSQFYSFTVAKGDTSAEVSQKISDILNKVQGCNFAATYTEYEADLESKWRGETANALKVRVDVNDSPAGMTYTVTPGQAGAGIPDIADALEDIKDKWNPIIVNPYGTNADICDALEAWNGKPDENTPTGQYRGIVMKPAIAVTGSVAEDPSSFTDARKGELTIAIAPAPLSEGLPMEAAANMAALFAKILQNSPELDVMDSQYPDMPMPIDKKIGAMSDDQERDRIVKAGCSTVMVVNDKYQVVDFVTTYHPDGELIPAYRFCRDLGAAFNIRYTFLQTEKRVMKGKVIVNDDDTVNKDKKVVRPSTWKASLYDMYDDLVARAICADPAFFKANLSAQISTVNKDRFETAFVTKLTGIARISDTENTLGFNFGSNS